METVAQYSSQDLPQHFAWQMLDFARMEWQDDITHDLSLELHPEKWHPSYFVMASDQMMISSATVLWTMIEFQGHSYKVYGLGLVLTYPEYRKQGYGRQVVSVATRFIQQEATADLAILQTAPQLEQFYGEHGWIHTPNITVLSGSPENPIDTDAWIMTMFLGMVQNPRKLE
jgi:predicted acetyltransferase